MSRNGRVQTKSNASFRIAARVRSDFAIFVDCWGLTWSGEGDLVFRDMMSEINDIMSVCQGKYAE